MSKHIVYLTVVADNTDVINKRYVVGCSYLISPAMHFAGEVTVQTVVIHDKKHQGKTRRLAFSGQRHAWR